jgi:hypothetical protein
VHPDPQSEQFYQEMSAKIAELPEHVRHDAVFALFGVGLRMMDRPTILALRDELVERFSQSADERDRGTTLIDIIDGHLALRDLRETPDC